MEKRKETEKIKGCIKEIVCVGGGGTTSKVYMFDSRKQNWENECGSFVMEIYLQLLLSNSVSISIGGMTFERVYIHTYINLL